MLVNEVQIKVGVLTGTASSLHAEASGVSGGISSWSYDHIQQWRTDTGAVETHVNSACFETSDASYLKHWPYCSGVHSLVFFQLPLPWESRATVCVCTAEQ